MNIRNHIRDIIFISLTLVTIGAVLSMFFMCQACKDSCSLKEASNETNCYIGGMWNRGIFRGYVVQVLTIDNYTLKDINSHVSGLFNEYINRT